MIACDPLFFSWAAGGLATTQSCQSAEGDRNLRRALTATYRLGTWHALRTRFTRRVGGSGAQCWSATISNRSFSVWRIWLSAAAGFCRTLEITRGRQAASSIHVDGSVMTGADDLPAATGRAPPGCPTGRTLLVHLPTASSFLAAFGISQYLSVLRGVPLNISRFEDPMKRATLLTALMALSACATQETATTAPEPPTEAAARCATDCVLVHGGMVRGCVEGPAGVTGRGAEVKICIDNADEELGYCYRRCE